MKKRRKMVAVLCAATVCFAAAADVLISNFVLFIKKYDVCVPVTSDIRIAFMSDIHLGESHVGTDSIVLQTKKTEPDIICLTGDIISSEHLSDSYGDFIALLEALAEIAPVYYSFGNHEKDIINSGFAEFSEDIESCGATVLDNSYADITVKGNRFRLGGILDEVFHFFYTKEDFSQSPRADFLREFNSTELFTVMLCHRSDSLSNYENYGVKLADLVLSGHTHGGVVRVPFGRGLYVPDMGWCRNLSYGRSTIAETDIIVTSGMASYGSVLRFNNPCEICCVTLKGDTA